tara:strand:- start:1514 stop:2122 length:609 start_codon:yes stop_codon:yes gene_type:complete
MISFYKPTERVTGTALSFYLNKNDKNAKDGFSFWGELLKQASWDNSKRQGDFRANKKVSGKNINIKFSQTEIASFIDAMERNTEFTGYHGSNQVVRFSFGPYIPKKQVKGEWVEGKEQKGFSFRVTREDKEDSTNKASFVIALNYGEAVLLKTYLRHALKESFNLVDKKREEYFKNNYNKQGSNSPQEEYVQPVEVEEDDLW